MNIQDKKAPSEYIEEVLQIRRVSKKTTGGNSISFSSLVVVGDQKGKVGVGLGSASEVPKAIEKSISSAKKNMIAIKIVNETIAHSLYFKFKAAKILLKPAPLGVGLKVGSVMRSILYVAGVKNASGKIIRSRNKITNAYAVIEGLKKL